MCGQTIVDALLKGVSNSYILLRQLQKEYQAVLEGKISRNLDDQSIFEYICNAFSIYSAVLVDNGRPLYINSPVFGTCQLFETDSRVTQCNI